MNALPAWIDREAWDGFVEMRKAKKRVPWTSRAETLIVKTLYRLHAAGQDPNAALDQSTLHGWSDVYEPKAKEITNMKREYMTTAIEPMTAEQKEAADKVRRMVMGSIKLVRAA